MSDGFYSTDWDNQDQSAYNQQYDPNAYTQSYDQTGKVKNFLKNWKKNQFFYARIICNFPESLQSESVRWTKLVSTW